MPVQTESSAGPQIVRGRVDTVSLYEVTELELQVMEEGSAGSVFLSFAIFFISVGLSFLSSTLASPVESDRVFIVFVVIIVISSFLGLAFLIVWRTKSRKLRVVIQAVRDRCVAVSHQPAPTAKIVKDETDATESG